MNDRRFEPRISDAELVMLSWNEGGTTLRQLGSVENLSPNGAGMIVDDPLRVGSTVTMTYGEGELTAVVRHCTALAEGYSIGVEFVESSKDSALHFHPELLVWPL
jgi:PilZ domain